jgi:hypothetical protein
MEKDNTNIYILECEDNKYYVGRTDDVESRLNDHFNSDIYASAWTTYYPPKSVYKFIPNQSYFDEDKWVVKMMAEFGINKVRGGAFSRVNLPEEDKIILQRMVDGSKDNCLVCGDCNHFANNCPYANELPQKMLKKRKKKKNIGFKIGKAIKIFSEAIIEGVIDEKNDTKEEKYSENNKCFKCGREGHWANNCYSKRHINGKILKQC